MIQELLFCVPDSLGRLNAGVDFAVAGLGLALSLVGARFGRSVVALALVSAGTIIGLQMPRWFGWGIDPMGTAFGGAIVLGLSGYILTAMWEGIFLCSLLAAGAGFAVWMNLAPHVGWHWPAVDWATTALEIAGKIRLSLPEALVTALPAALGIGATAGALLMVLWPRLGRVLFYSLVGMGLLAAGSALGVRRAHPELLAAIPRDGWIQGAIFGLLVIFSAGVQWLVSRRVGQPQGAEPADNNPDCSSGNAGRVGRRLESAEPFVATHPLPQRPAGIRPHRISAGMK